MGIIDNLVKQSGKPSGLLGRIMVTIMNYMDSGLNQWIIEKINKPEGTALEIGCGGGKTINHLLKNNRIKHIVGIDYSLESINMAKKKNKAYVKLGKAEIVQGDVAALPFSQYFFDIVIAVRSHYFWEDHKKAFSEIYRTLKKDGQMIIFSEKFKIQYHMNTYNTDESMTQLLKAIGFHNIFIENREAVQCITATK